MHLSALVKWGKNKPCHRCCPIVTQTRLARWTHYKPYLSIHPEGITRRCCIYVLPMYINICVYRLQTAVVFLFLRNDVRNHSLSTFFSKTRSCREWIEQILTSVSMPSGLNNYSSLIVLNRRLLLAQLTKNIRSTLVNKSISRFETQSYIITTKNSGRTAKLTERKASARRETRN